MQRKIRVLVGKPGLDGHDRGAKVVAAALRDAGMEVIYTGLHQTAEQIVEAAMQEDVDVVALSILSGAHMTLFPEVRELMRERGIDDKLLTGGGIIPAEDMDTLAKDGVGRLFGPGASTRDIIDYVREWYASKHGAGALAPLPPPRAAATMGPAAPPRRPPVNAAPVRAKAAAPKRAARASVAPKRAARTNGTAKRAARTSATPARGAKKRAGAGARSRAKTRGGSRRG
jgi:methylmalonyl-CoA mutase C-terminal domain/subunit